MRLVLLAVLVTMVSASCSVEYSTGDQLSVQDTLEAQRKLSVADCKDGGKVDRMLLQQSWYREGSSDALAFGGYAFSDRSTGIEASYCLEGNVIVARTYKDIPRISVAGLVVRSFSRRSASTPDIRWQIEELTPHTLVLNDLVSSGTRTTWHRRN